MSSESRRSRSSRSGVPSPASGNQEVHVGSSDLFARPAGAPTTEPSGIHDSELSSPMSYGSEVLAPVGPGPLGHGEEGANRPRINLSTGDVAAAAGSESDVLSGAPGSNLVIWGTDVNMDRVASRFTTFLRTFEAPEDSDGQVESAARSAAVPLYLYKLDECAAEGQPYLELDCVHLLAKDPELYRQMVTYPSEVIPHMDVVAFRELQRRHAGQGDLPDSIHIQPFNCDQSRALRHLNPEDLDQLVSLTGMVIRLTPIIPEMLEAYFKCGVCGSSTTVGLDRGRIPEPTLCTNCNGAHTFDVTHNRCKFSDKQIVKLQEAPEDMPAGQTPQTVQLFAYADQVDKVSPGDRIKVTGIFRATPIRPNPNQRNVKAVYRTHIDVVHFKRESGVGKSASMSPGEENTLHLSAERFELLKKLNAAPDLYERLSAAIAPSIYENEDVKKGILLQLFGGTRKDLSAAGRDGFRSEVNVLLCGDPGTSKSQLLQYVFRLMPRSQYTSGKGSSAVGLTAYVTKDPETKQMTLQTGALVLADNGVCCIDEFDKMSDAARAILHEVMEQQTLSIAKAGIICQLNARASVLAAANPLHSKWDAKKTIIENIQLPHTLLSRFDLIFLILDPQDETYDARLARHLVTCYYKSPEDALEESLEMDLLRDYIQYARARVEPRLSESAQHYLVEEYVEMRRLGSGRGQVSAYPRQLESLIRLAEAHAKMRWSQEVTEADCREARRLQKEALKQAATDPTTGFIDVNILTTGVSNSLRKRREEMASAIWDFLQERRVKSFTVAGVLQELKTRSDRLITRDLFEDGLNALKNENKIDWAGNTIRVK